MGAGEVCAKHTKEGVNQQSAAIKQGLKLNVVKALTRLFFERREAL